MPKHEAGDRPTHREPKMRKMASIDLGGWHTVGGRRASNRGVLFEKMVTFNVAFRLFTETAEAFSVCSDHGDYGKFQDLVVVIPGKDGRKATVDAIELKHSRQELGDRHFSPSNGKVRLTAFLKSFRDKRSTLEACDRLTIGTNNTLDSSVAGNFRPTSDGVWYLGERDMWALEEGSQLRRDLGGASDKDVETFSEKLRFATAIPDADALRDRITRKLGEIYGAEGYSGTALMSLYLHFKDNFEQWYDHEPRAVTRDMMEGFVDKAKDAVKV
ncbi:uncharacterized protein LOC124154344 [Ischnura elegans]|uniref:uncharacterized protein LOC124154344 n=1 Tax=Ischnura elegans TaxID=197161 RepID=UPI001ED8AAE7|nr:uncharacterized protein LOC124154344 [Ischnura elegans]